MSSRVTITGGADGSTCVILHVLVCRMRFEVPVVLSFCFTVALKGGICQSCSLAGWLHLSHIRGIMKTRPSSPLAFSLSSTSADRSETGGGDGINPDELVRFSQLAEEWWDESGALASLHHLTPARMAFIRNAVAAGLREGELSPCDRCSLEGLEVLDLGCGGGLLAEPMTRLGARVTGVDATEEAIQAAQAHAVRGGLAIDYVHGTVDDLPRKQGLFDLVVASEILEHVPDPEVFLGKACSRLKPGGVLVITTVNRSLKSLLLGVVVAEKVLKLVPEGLHDWQAFLKPSEVAGILRDLGMSVGDISGLRYNPFNQRARLTPHDLGINYLMWAKKD